jgi:zinc transport system ATP-binding protein
MKARNSKLSCLKPLTKRLITMIKDNQAILKVSNLNVNLQNQPILQNINFEVKKGTTLGILGPNGAGKSVLLKTLLNILPHTGNIEWSQKVKTGYVPQNISGMDIPISVKEFLTMGNEKDIQASLESVRLNSSQVLNKRLGVLSGGQLRRVMIAWALTNEPDVLLLDEPTTGVDMDSEEPIYLMLNEVKKKKQMTILLITHNIHIIQEYTDDLLAINKCLTFHGPSKEIAKPETQKMIYGETVCVETIKEERGHHHD